MSHLPHCQSARIQKHWEFLCWGIGERRAGSLGESRAADYLLKQFAGLQLKSVHQEPFACISVQSSSVRLEVAEGSRFKRIPARVLAGSSSTPGRSVLEGELHWIEMPEQAARAFRGPLKGKIVVLFGPLPTDPALHRQLVAGEPLAVVHIDDRLPFHWLKDDGVYPAWVERYGMPPAITIPYRSAWNLKKTGARRARLQVSVKQTEGLSQNVCGEISGTEPALPLLLLGAHHDTQCHNVGADDNASGVVALLELAALLGKRKFRRTIRFVSFGVEEQLSVGSARYVMDHRENLSNIGMVFNFDAISSFLGHFQLWRAGSSEFGACLTQELGRCNLDVVEKTDVSPFGDHFPFTAFGIPAATLYRPNMDSGMRWQHHSAQDNLDEVSVNELGRAVRAVAGVVELLANDRAWPFQKGLPEPQKARTKQLFKDLYNLSAE